MSVPPTDEGVRVESPASGRGGCCDEATLVHSPTDSGISCLHQAPNSERRSGSASCSSWEDSFSKRWRVDPDRELKDWSWTSGLGGDPCRSPPRSLVRLKISMTLVVFTKHVCYECSNNQEAKGTSTVFSTAHKHPAGGCTYVWMTVMTCGRKLEVTFITHSRYLSLRTGRKKYGRRPEGAISAMRDELPLRISEVQRGLPYHEGEELGHVLDFVELSCVAKITRPSQDC